MTGGSLFARQDFEIPGFTHFAPTEISETNGRYLCIVPAQSASAGEGRVFLPFEGETTLSVILSKAFLLTDERQPDQASVNLSVETVAR